MTANIRAARVEPTEAPAGDYYSVETYIAENSAGYLIAGVRSRLFNILDEELGKFGITAAQWAVLRAVADGKTPSAADLCRQLNYDTGSMTRMLQRLEDKDLVVRETSEEDRRVVLLRIAPAGRKLYPKLRDAVIRVLNRLVTGFTPEEVRQVNAQLMRMMANLEAPPNER